ncbi:MAG: hypothetical protein BWY43_00553 [candidate division WS2 bacterium ADurb.Bin280]|uniref:Uncharacterized protein n=1 Tax=candidate division WS2 bacterium ADurb.Bin280 TaxID=1852829 RepID=A0A1V5SCR2_9BACT|nr:MAG: hypothetical protein BWY43_00553 [candidate division WS2 bacterium ADurb.Bin280]
MVSSAVSFSCPLSRSRLSISSRNSLSSLCSSSREARSKLLQSSLKITASFRSKYNNRRLQLTLSSSMIGSRPPVTMMRDAILAICSSRAVRYSDRWLEAVVSGARRSSPMRLRISVRSLSRPSGSGSGSIANIIAVNSLSYIDRTSALGRCARSSGSGSRVPSSTVSHLGACESSASVGFSSSSATSSATGALPVPSQAVQVVHVRTPTPFIDPLPSQTGHLLPSSSPTPSIVRLMPQLGHSPFIPPSEPTLPPLPPQNVQGLSGI